MHKLMILNADFKKLTTNSTKGTFSENYSFLKISILTIFYKWHIRNLKIISEFIFEIFLLTLTTNLGLRYIRTLDNRNYFNEIRLEFCSNKYLAPYSFLFPSTKNPSAAIQCFTHPKEPIIY